MLYVICALKAEAQAFVDKYRLDKSMKNSEIQVVVSGIGEQNMFEATKNTLHLLDDNDTIINVGICGADKTFDIGELLEVCIQTNLINNRYILTCIDTPVATQNNYEVVDMESSGFIQATKNFKQSYMFKIVSDHFNPQDITKDKAKLLVFNRIDGINKLLKLKVQVTLNAKDN